MTEDRTSERLRCRCCGIGSPDVGFTVDGDVLCDDCETRTAAHIAALVYSGFIRERARELASREERARVGKAAFSALVAQTFGSRPAVPR